jgi:DNA-binding NarL/FixJ family response regulator
MLPHTKTDIALLDIGMPGKGGIETLKELKENIPEIQGRHAHNL